MLPTIEPAFGDDIGINSNEFYATMNLNFE